MKMLRNLLIAFLAMSVFWLSPAEAQYRSLGTASLSVSNSSSRVVLPAPPFGTIVTVINIGANEVFVAFGSSTVSATTSSESVPPSAARCFSVSSQTYVAAITASSTSTLRISQGVGPCDVAIGGGSVSSGTAGYLAYYAGTGSTVSQEQFATLAQGGLGGSQAAATAGQISQFPGGGGAAVPTTPAPINMIGYGCDPTGAVDCATLLTAALAVSPNIYFPPGKYKFNSNIAYTIPNALAAVSLQCAGSENTILNWPNAGGGFTFTYSGAAKNAVHVKGCTFTTTTTAGGSAIKLSNTISIGNPANTAQSTFDDIGCRGDDGQAATDYWTKCLEIANVSNVQVNAMMVQGTGSSQGSGVTVVGLPGSTTYAVAINLARLTCDSVSVCFEYGAYVQGVTINQMNATGGTWGVHVAAGLTGNLEQLAISNSQFANVSNIITGTRIGGLQIVNSVFGVTAVSNGLDLDLTGNTIIVGNDFEGNASSNGLTIGATQSGSSVTIIGNRITGWSTGVAIWLKAGSLGITATGNFFENNSTNILNSSTDPTNSIGPNVGDATLIGAWFATANTANTLVERDGSGNFAAGTITASLTGHSSLDCALTGCTLGGTISGGGNQINNVIIGTTTPLAGSFTALTGTTFSLGPNPFFQYDASYFYMTNRANTGFAAIFGGGASNNIFRADGGHTFENGAGSISFGIIGAAGISTPIAYAFTNLLWSATAPSIASGFCSTGSPVTALSASNGTAAFDILIGAATCGSTGTLTMPAATTGWVCSAADVTTPASHNVVQTGTNGSTTAVVLTDYSRTTGIAQNFNPADHIHVMCTAY
jgi:hypothetical protein